jgi:hypothetical protein
MLGCTETSSGPEVAPEGIVMTIEVLVHELTVTGTSLSVAKLPFCEAPKPDPLMSTWLPTDPVVADVLVMVGAADAVELMETPSNVTVARAELLATARPM